MNVEISSQETRNCFNKKINSISLIDNKINIVFEDNTTLIIEDSGQSCCEIRYIVIDNDNLNYFVNSTFRGLDLLRVENKDQHKLSPSEKEIKEHELSSEDYFSFEVVFLEIRTSKGSISFSTRNSHNGYYSGFTLKISLK